MAIGGGGFLSQPHPSPLDDYVVALARKPRPRICFVPTASGDSEEMLEKFYAAFARFPAELSHLAFFRKPRPGAIPLGEIEQRIGEQDLVYVGGGNTRSMLAVWREWGLPQTLRNACARGVVLAGVSAGAICWFEWGASDSSAPGMRSAPLRCLGFLRGSCSPHWGGEVHRRKDFHGMIRGGHVPGGYGLGDGTALLFEEGRLVEAVGADASTAAFRVERAGDRLLETELPLRLLPAAVQGRAAAPPHRAASRR